jgi:hypothetical protein
MNDLVAKAVERDVELIPVYAEALDRGDFDLSSGRQSLMTDPFQTGMSVPTAGDGQLSPHLAAAAAMGRLANDTGAEAVTLGRDAVSRLGRIERRAAYTLSFRDPAGDHRYHRIVLKCRRFGTKLVYRRAYRVPAEDERRLDTVVARFLEPDRGTDPMNVAVTPTSWRERGSEITGLLVSYAPPLEQGAEDLRSVEVVGIGEDAQGHRTAPIEWKGTARRTEELRTFRTLLALKVPPKYVWSLAVRDQPTGLTSYVLVRSANPAQ